MEKIFTFPKIVFYIAVFLVASLLLIIIATKFNACNDFNGGSFAETVIVHDTLIITRYEKDIDTVIKWKDKILFKEVPAKIEYRMKVDSVFIDKIKAFDFILGLDKINTRLRIYAVNLQDSLIKERYFENVGNNFSVYGKARGVFVKSQKFYFEGVQLQAAYSFPNLKYNEGGFSAGLRTGVNYMNTFGVEVSSEYIAHRKELETKLLGKFKIF